MGDRQLGFWGVSSRLPKPSLLFVVIFERRHCLPHADVGKFLLPGEEIIFVVYIIEVGQGLGSSERMRGYNC